MVQSCGRGVVRVGGMASPKGDHAPWRLAGHGHPLRGMTMPPAGLSSRGRRNDVSADGCNSASPTVR